MAAAGAASDRGSAEATTAAAKEASAAAVPLLAGLAETRNLVGQVNRSSLSPAAKNDLLASLATKVEQLQRAANLALGTGLEALVAAPAAPGPGTRIRGRAWAESVRHRATERSGRMAAD